MFKRILKMDSAPSYNVFWWLLTRLNPSQLENSLVRWVQALPQGDEEKLRGIDGKHLRGASKRGKKIHLVSAWESSKFIVRTGESKGKIE